MRAREVSTPPNPEMLSPASEFLICLLLKVLCVVMFFVILCQIMKRYCLAFFEDPTFLLRRRSERRLLGENNVNEPSSQLQLEGLASPVIHSLPVLQFSNETKRAGGTGIQSSTDCAVCLGEFSEGEWLRLLRNCSHAFHVSCIDTWLRSHSNCPLCRTNVLCDFPHPAPASMVLETVQWEDMHREGHPYRLFESLLDAAMAPERSGLGSDSEESSSSTLSPVAGLVNQDSVETLIKLAHTFKGESSSSDLDFHGHSAQGLNGASGVS